MIEQKKQSVKFVERLFTYSAGTGKDARIFIKFMTIENGKKYIYNIPLVTLSSIQVFTSKAKEPRYTMGNANPRKVTEGVRRVAGHLTAATFNETIGRKIRRELKNYQPIEASKLNLDTSGTITLDELDKLTYLDQLPPCDIRIFLTNPYTKKVYKRMIYGCTFNAESHSIGSGAAMGEQYSFIAMDLGGIIYDDISKETIIKKD